MACSLQDSVCAAFGSGHYSLESLARAYEALAYIKLACIHAEVVLGICHSALQ